MIKQKLEEVRALIKESAESVGRKYEDVTLVAVTKTHGADVINEAIKCGVTDIGENKVQEILEKYDDVLPVRWHLIGHLQTNKVKYIIDKVCMIHSVDSVHLMDEIERSAIKKGIPAMDILIEVNISGEESKFGVRPDEVDTLLSHAAELERVKVKGLMTILPKNCENVTRTLLFNNICKLFIDIKSKTYDNVSMEKLSMGMSGDFEEAIKHGANMVRVGSKIFGERKYNIKAEE